MAAYEWVVVCYFVVLSLAAWTVPVPTSRRLWATALGASVLVAVPVSAVAAPAFRAWLPHVYLVAGYWMPALLVPGSRGRRFEEWLHRTDRRWRAALPAVPGWLSPITELAYLFCFPLVPLSFAIVWMIGSGADVDRFWFAVLASGFSCYVSLPWLVSRPLRLLETDETRGPLAGVNSRVLSRVSHEFNTFPSGHVAVAAAAAGAVASVSAPLGALLGLVVLAIGVVAASGRYHYVVDVVLGLGVAAAALLAAAAV